MNKAAPFLVSVIAASLFILSCTGGESLDNSSGKGGSGTTGVGTGSGGNNSATTSSGGASVSSSSGGSTSSSSGTGGQVMSSSSGGTSTSGPGGVIGGIGAGGTTSAAGSGGSTIIVGGGAAGSTAVAGGMDSAFSIDGYGMNTVWRGYVYPAAYGTKATIVPAVMFPVGKQLCVSGNIGMDAPGASGALIGWNINQQKSVTTTPAPALAAAPTGTGLAIVLSGMTTGLRLQVEDLSTPAKQWCYNVTGPSMMVPWTSFNTMCWDPANPLAAAYSPATPIKDISILAQSGALPISFNFCLLDAKPY